MSKRFDVYRYQIIPVWRRQLQLFNKSMTESELIEIKNRLFFDALVKLVEEGNIFYRDHEVIQRVLLEEDDLLVLQIGLNRGRVPVENPDFTEERFDTYPSLIIGFNNDPDVQYLFIEREYKAFRKSHIAADMLKNNLNSALEEHMLHVEINPIFREQDFWDLVKKYPSINHLEFELVAPNLTNIHGAIEDSMGKWFPNTNSQTIDIKMNSDKKANLTVDKNIEPIRSFAEYASKGGGNITIRAKEAKFKISTKNSVIQVECRGLEIHADGNVSGLEELAALLNTEVDDEGTN